MNLEIALLCGPLSATLMPMSHPRTSAPRFSRRTLKFTLFVLFVMALVSLPFVLFGQEYALPILGSYAEQKWALALVGVALLTADAVAPVPSALVIILVAAKAGWLIGTLTGVIGLSGQVGCAAWFGRAAVGRLAPKFFRDEELTRLRNSLHQRLALTLGCLRCVPVFAESSVLVAGSLGIPIPRIIWVTLAPNLAISAIYSIAVNDSFATACAAVLGTIFLSFAVWRAQRPA